MDNPIDQSEDKFKTSFENPTGKSPVIASSSSFECFEKLQSEKMTTSGTKEQNNPKDGSSDSSHHPEPSRQLTSGLRFFHFSLNGF